MVRAYKEVALISITSFLLEKSSIENKHMFRYNMALKNAPFHIEIKYPL